MKYIVWFPDDNTYYGLFESRPEAAVWASGFETTWTIEPLHTPRAAPEGGGSDDGQ